MKKMIVAANWKMNKTLSEAQAYLTELKSALAPSPTAQALFFPPAVFLPCFQKELQGTPIFFGAQNCHFEASGAFTGEMSVPMLKDFGISTVLIGHSERRHIFSETDAMLAKKVSAVLKAGLSPLLCVGENEDERVFGKTLDRITHQLEQGLSLVETPESIVIAYEPVWAIGTGKVASAKDIWRVHQFIRDWLVQKWGDSGLAVPLLYGGSLTAQNCKEIAAIENVNGFLIGGASLKVSSYLEIFQSV